MKINPTKFFETLMKMKNKYIKTPFIDMSIEDHEKHWFGQANRNISLGISLKDSMRIANLTYDEVTLGIGAKHHPEIHFTKSELTLIRGKIAEIKTKYPDFVESEKKTISDRRFEEIDKLEAKLRRLESQSQEQEQINSQQNQ
ncbi:MAG: hypothetical protein RIF34_01715 [Candidatus Kapaibacterium sp.]